MKNIIPILALFFVFGFYPSTSSGQNIKQPIPGQIVLIFKNAPDNSYYIGAVGIKEKKSDYQVSYVDDHLIRRGFNFKNATMYDTLVIKTHRNFIELSHTYKGLSSMRYLIKNGDTVLFTYQGNKPWAQVLNRKVLASEINYDYLVNERIRHDDYSAMTKYSHPPEFTKNPPPSFKEQFAMAKVQFEKESKEELAKTNYFLDSIRKANAISETYYNYQKLNFIYLLHSLTFYNKWKFSDSLLKNNRFQNKLFPTLTHENDTLLFYGYYREYVSKKYNTLQLKAKKIKKMAIPNSFSTDYREVFDSICNWNNLYIKVKNYFLLQTMEKICQEYWPSDVEKYTKKFRKEVKDTTLLSYIEQKYRIDPPTSNELELQDTMGNNKTFKEILNSHKGKVVYVDFWASWCGACLANMPDSKKLDAEFGLKGVVFIYITTDKKLDDWKYRIQEIGLKENNYVIRNDKSSKMFEELEISTIPRYLLYNKQGKLVHKDAPRPSYTAEIRKLFNQYLLE